MRDEKAKNNHHYLKLFLIFSISVIIIWAGISLHSDSKFSGRVSADLKPRRFFEYIKGIPDIVSRVCARGVCIRNSLVIDMDAIEKEAEQKAQEQADMVKTMQSNEVAGGYVEGTDEELDMRLLQQRKWRWIINRLMEIMAEEEARMIRDDMINRINGYLANRGSPMQGTGQYFYDEAKEYGIEPRLSVAIAEAESSCDMACFAPYNAWGMLAYRSGFSSWQEGIHQNIEWLHRYFGSPQTAYDCPGYCVPDHPWMENVEGVRQSI